MRHLRRLPTGRPRRPRNEAATVADIDEEVILIIYMKAEDGIMMISTVSILKIRTKLSRD
jgi:hypothetical protein